MVLKMSASAAGAILDALKSSVSCLCKLRLQSRSSRRRCRR
jgi:hypothetical protein